MRAAIALATLIMTAPAMAADPITVPLGMADVPIHDSATGPDWSGFYAGVYGVGQLGGDAEAVGLGVSLGYNAALEFVLVGAEVSVQGLAVEGDTTAYGQLLGRAGVFVSDEVMVYAAGGYGLQLGTTAEDAFLLGGGVELALNDDVTLRGQYLRELPNNGGDAGNQFSLGANFHF
ncbi:outer membrane immunogenic protein [Devosia enhydra]|uniref:Outer membrane immunogenic protein n=1 Tax=Devosia enhydra TaxID=665118 RepID=A0A1K2HVW1_9HYPH|nr:hypothetical protein [Devosia enhydra]SFZ82640.1 outer membrane immunogenic protein [Devosia enhydra]